MDSAKFRVRVLLEAVNGRICFIFINTNIFKSIKDVENHIQKIFKLPPVELYVDDVLLPSEETISLIYPEDTLCVKKINRQQVVPQTLESEVKDEIEELRDALQERKQILSVEQDMDVTVTDDTVPNGNDETDTKRKRHRKRSKKKLKQELNTKKCYLETSLDTDSVKSYGPSSSRVHIKFDVEEDIDDDIDVPSPLSQKKPKNSDISQPSTSREATESQEEWQTKLLNLAKEKERSNKIFSAEIRPSSRNNASEGVNGTNGLPSISNLRPADYPLMNRFPQNGESIIFRKLKLDELYNPVSSGYILGKVVNSHSPFVTLNILDGSEELKEPKGKFTMDDSDTENNENDLLKNVTLRWTCDVIEPRLITD